MSDKCLALMGHPNLWSITIWNRLEWQEAGCYSSSRALVWCDWAGIRVNPFTHVHLTTSLFLCCFQERAKEQHVPITVLPHPGAAEPLALQIEKESTGVIHCMFSFSDPSISHPGIASIFFPPLHMTSFVGKLFSVFHLLVAFRCVLRTLCHSVP